MKLKCSHTSKTNMLKRAFKEDKAMKKITEKETYIEESNKEHPRYTHDSALWELNGTTFAKVDGWWNYQREDGLTCWEIDGGPFKTLKQAKAAALKSFETHPLRKEVK